jgi:hypothetical protein
MEHRSKAIGATALALIVMALAASCVSAPYMPRESKVNELAALIDSGRVTEVKGLATAPFLLDREILLRQSDVDAAWSNLKAAQFSLSSPKVASISRIGPDSYTAFGAAMDVRTFFKKYLDKDSVLVALDSNAGRYYLILNREVGGYPRIQGIAGPLK